MLPVDFPVPGMKSVEINAIENNGYLLIRNPVVLDDILLDHL